MRRGKDNAIGAYTRNLNYRKIDKTEKNYTKGGNLPQISKQDMFSHKWGILLDIFKLFCLS